MCRPRDTMPQLDLKDYPFFIHWCANNGINLRHSLIPPQSVHSVQCWGEWRTRKVRKTTLMKPCLISADRIILDGNSRWASHLMCNSELMPAYTLPFDFAEAFAVMLRFPNTYIYGDGNKHPYTV